MIQSNVNPANNIQENVPETRIWLKKYYSTPIDEIQQILLATGYSIAKTLEILRQRERLPEFAP